MSTVDGWYMFYFLGSFSPLCPQIHLFCEVLDQSSREKDSIQTAPAYIKKDVVLKILKSFIGYLLFVQKGGMQSLMTMDICRPMPEISCSIIKINIE